MVDKTEMAFSRFQEILRKTISVVLNPGEYYLPLLAIGTLLFWWPLLAPIVLICFGATSLVLAPLMHILPQSSVLNLIYGIFYFSISGIFSLYVIYAIASRTFLNRSISIRRLRLLPAAFIAFSAAYLLFMLFPYETRSVDKTLERGNPARYYSRQIQEELIFRFPREFVNEAIRKIFITTESSEGCSILPVREEFRLKLKCSSHEMKTLAQASPPLLFTSYNSERSIDLVRKNPAFPQIQSGQTETIVRYFATFRGIHKKVTVSKGYSELELESDSNK